MDKTLLEKQYLRKQGATLKYIIVVNKNYIKKVQWILELTSLKTYKNFKTLDGNGFVRNAKRTEHLAYKMHLA